MNRKELNVLRGLLSRPVSPFHEEAIVEWIAGWARRREVSFTRDAVGNVVLRTGRRRRRGGWVFAAHMDHPGFITTRRRGRNVWARFRGSVRPEYGLGERVRLFAPGGEVTATVATRRAIRPRPWWSCRLDLDAPADVPPGTVGMWDVPAFRLRGKRLFARSCDDLAGVAAVLCSLERVRAAAPSADVTALLTRAEEAGFVGALAACRSGTIPRDAMVVAIEASQAHPGAPLGGGAIVRVGDATCTFDRMLDLHISAVARSLARRRKTVRFTRQLMPGGTCESTVYCVFGFRAAALAMPLGNYHNMADDGRIGPEQIDLDDFESLVSLLASLPGGAVTPEAREAALRAHLLALLKERGPLLGLSWDGGQDAP